MAPHLAQTLVRHLSTPGSQKKLPSRYAVKGELILKLTLDFERFEEKWRRELFYAN